MLVDSFNYPIDPARPPPPVPIIESLTTRFTFLLNFRTGMHRASSRSCRPPADEISGNSPCLDKSLARIWGNFRSGENMKKYRFSNQWQAFAFSSLFLRLELGKIIFIQFNSSLNCALPKNIDRRIISKWKKKKRKQFKETEALNPFLFPSPAPDHKNETPYPPKHQG